jgi:hypothetical protein
VANENDRLSVMGCAMGFDNDGKKLHQSFGSVGIPSLWLEA